MCRLLGVASVSPTSVADTVGDTVLADFLALTKIHGDGWGVASVLDVDDAPRVEVSADSALEDPRFGTATKEAARGSVVHLRWATNGLAVQPENSHPFAADGVAMAHNGSIKPIGALEALLEPSVASTLRGTTDSERYFALLRQHRAAATDLVEAVRRAVAELRHLYPDASLNALLLGEGQLIAVHAHARSRLLDEDIEEISATDLPAEHLEDYFSLRIARPDENTVVIGSTGFGDLTWSPLPAESVASVSLADLSVTVVPIMAD
ncbi:class II glutamine amidotransferase [Mycolicibacterium chubuense]|uniref:Glucosamine--fructose-6-phosphate aminotransferase n=1 Tax=Mycolicibacterium chubuense TaxID=1800 RepID=A0A0J6WAE6_MYCCU|nr:class II glutamine amidotransferase [Mycolicibacterium chubuense]KMO78893.1 glucosamine--fructose-6-phosphate aminotransferase [Mycolicibacterium chubuense]ORA50228.1 class II glutamine amidotransferase [Mycolicibacterium chubuense]SPX96213.1 glutamine amidotransferase, class-II [Mycolicibacterium chubuense]